MNYQNDFFEHETNARLLELRQGIADKKEEIREMWDAVNRIASHMRGASITEDGKTKIVRGPNGRAFIISDRGEDSRTIIPISLDLLLAAVQELNQSGVRPFDGGTTNKIGPFGP